MHSSFDEKTHKAFLARLAPSERAKEDARLRAYGRIELIDAGLRSQVFVSRYRLNGNDYRYVREDNSLGQGWTELHCPTHRPEGYKALPEAFVRQALEATTHHAKDDRVARIFIASPAVRPDGIVQHEGSDRSYIYEVNFVTNKHGERELIVVGREASGDPVEFRKQWIALTGGEGLKSGNLSEGDTGYEAVVEKGKRPTGNQLVTKLAQGIISLTQNIPQYKGAVRYIDPYEAMKFPEKAHESRLNTDRVVTTVHTSSKLSWGGLNKTFTHVHQETSLSYSARGTAETSHSTIERNSIAGYNVKSSSQEVAPIVAPVFTVYREGPIASDFWSSAKPAKSAWLIDEIRVGDNGPTRPESFSRNENFWSQRKEIALSKGCIGRNTYNVQPLSSSRATATTRKEEEAYSDREIKTISDARKSSRMARSYSDAAPHHFLFNARSPGVDKPRRVFTKGIYRNKASRLSQTIHTRKTFSNPVVVRILPRHRLQKVVTKHIAQAKILLRKIASMSISIKEKFVRILSLKIKNVIQLIKIQKNHFVAALKQVHLLQKQSRHMVMVVRRVILRCSRSMLLRSSPLRLRIHSSLKRIKELHQILRSICSLVRIKSKNFISKSRGVFLLFRKNVVLRLASRMFSFKEKLLLSKKRFAKKIFSRRVEEFLLFLQQRHLYQWLLLRRRSLSMLFAKIFGRKKILHSSVTTLGASKITIPKTAL